MKVNRTLSEIIRGVWAMNPEVAQGYLPLVNSIILGKPIGDSEPKSYYDDYDPREKANREAKCEVQGISVFRKKDRWSSFDQAPDNSIAEIAIEGPLMKVGECGAPGYQAFTDWIKEADNSPRIHSIVLRVDTPGGSIWGVETMKDAVKSTKKPIVAFVDDGMAASAGYWFASAADEIVMSHSFSEVGSIGVFTTLADWYSYFEKQGLKIKDIYAPQSKDKNGDYRDALEGNEDKIKERLSSLAESFISTVKSNRSGKLNLSAGDPFTGKMYNAKEAIEIGLADRQASYEEVIIGLAKSQKDDKSNSSTMAKQHTNVNAALGVESLESTDDGVFINEEQLSALDTALEGNVQQLETQLQERDDTIEALNTAGDSNLNALNDQLVAAGKEPVKDMSAGIAQLGALVQEYGKASGASFTKTTPPDNVEEKGEGSENAELINAKIARDAGLPKY